MKSSEKSNALRREGNELYKRRNFFDALLKYNESLCYAENDSECAGHAYANRSAIYFEMKLYDECLENIKLALANNYPQKSFQILQKREEKCLMEAKKNDSKKIDNALDFFTLSYPPHDVVPSIANCLEMKCNEKFGRHIITNKSLAVGDIIAIDDPVYKVIKADDRYDTCYDNNVYQRCENCLMENNLNLFPCSKCTKAMFCCIQCKEISQKSHHKFECDMIENLLKSGLKHIVLRIFFEGISHFNDDINELKKYIEINEDKEINIFNMLSKGKEREKQIFIATLSLASHDENRADLSEYENFFKSSTKLEKMWRDHKKFIQSIFQKLVSIGKRDVHGIGKWSLKIKENSEEIPSQHQQLIGNAFYLFSSLLNHSCAPNVRRLNKDNKIILFCLKPIRKGSQLFDSYRQNFNMLEKSLRQESLLRDYGFVCDCEACTNNYPLNKELPVIDEKLLEYAWDSYNELPHLTKNIAKERLAKHYKVITKNHKHFPSSELIILQENISNLLIHITKPTVQFS